MLSLKFYIPTNDFYDICIIPHLVAIPRAQARDLGSASGGPTAIKKDPSGSANSSANSWPTAPVASAVLTDPAGSANSGPTARNMNEVGGRKNRAAPRAIFHLWVEKPHGFLCES